MLYAILAIISKLGISHFHTRQQGEHLALVTWHMHLDTRKLFPKADDTIWMCG